MALINQKIDQYKTILSMFADNTERYKFLIDLGRKAKPFPEEFRLENFKVHGCMSQVWLVPKYENDTIQYFCDSDAAIVKGTVSLVSDIYSGSSPKDIVANDRNLMTELDLGNILSMNRRNGAYNMLNMVKEQAKIFVGDKT
jgi:cysteine desulfuration protein SufE